ncbi:TATA box-binding protein-associated factor, RNA polymerase I, subunit C, partial [Stegodyphus mimosarum]
MTTLEENHEPYKCLRAVESVNVKLKRGNIFQVVSNFNGICYVRQKDRCHYINFSNPLDVTQNECLKKSGLLYICASSYIPEELLTISKNGELELYNIEIRQTLWDSNTSFQKDVLETDLWSCSFGSHPKSVLCLNEKRLHSFDLRCEKSVSAEIFSSSHSSCFINEKLLLTKELKMNSFQHVITSNDHLFVIDERYPNKPVMFWNHMLKDYPIYCDISTYQTTATSSDAVILLGTQKEREMMAFFLKSSLSEVQPVSLGPPFLLSSPSDCINSLKLHFINIDDKVARRFRYPLTGLCSVPNHQKCAFTAFQLTSLGDLFYQDFGKTESDFVNNNIERTYHFGTGCVLSPPEKISPYLTDWIESSCVTEEDAPLNTELTELIRVNVDLTDMLSIPDEISTDCVLCRCSSSHRDKNLLALDPCPSCGLSSVYSQQLSEASTNLGVLIGPVLTNTDLSNFDVADLSQFTDPFSKRLLDVWLEADDFNRSQETTFQDVNMESLFLHSSPKTPRVSSLPTNWDSSMTPSMSLEATSMTNIQPFSSLQTTSADFLGSQSITDELIPPSQDTRPLIGETVRTPKDLKLMINKRVKSVIGF